MKCKTFQTFLGLVSKVHLVKTGEGFAEQGGGWFWFRSNQSFTCCCAFFCMWGKHVSVLTGMRVCLQICIKQTCTPLMKLRIPKCPDCHSNGVSCSSVFSFGDITSGSQTSVREKMQSRSEWQCCWTGVVVQLAWNTLPLWFFFLFKMSPTTETLCCSWFVFLFNMSPTKLICPKLFRNCLLTAFLFYFLIPAIHKWCVCVCACAWACACVCVCLHACVRMCTCMCVASVIVKCSALPLYLEDVSGV